MMMQRMNESAGYQLLSYKAFAIKQLHRKVHLWSYITL